MAGFIKKVLKISVITAVLPVLAFAAQQQNPRGNNNKNNLRSIDSETSASIRRSATSVIARTTAVNSRKNRTVVTARPATKVSARSARPVVNGASISRAATKASLVRSGAKPITKNNANFSRAGTARATAVFNDVSKIGGGYSACRDSYATCMDQFCANANDTYRRCFCSDRFNDFRETADKLDTALKLLADFQDNNLNAVDKSAAEVNAMYTATAGEAAIKRDTSASQKLLDSIGDVLSGKSSTPDKKQGVNTLGVLDFSGFGSSNDDIFGGGASSIFGGGDSTNMAELEGKALYDSASKQCSEITRESCGGDAMFNLAKSAYSIMITQDCNMYEKNISAKKASVEETVRTAEKYLRDARLEEYRSHNSADVNECLNKVETALRQPTACGENYEKCLDYTGQYINTSTGEPIYSQALFGLNSLIVLDGTADVLKANKKFDTWLDGKKMFATTALDSCRDLADTVWYEFKRSALIQIAQAQDEKIQQIKDSCVMTIKECYDAQSGALSEIDTTEMKSTGAIVAVTARGMCYDRVQACAALYGDPDGCQYDDKTKTLSPSPVEGKKCGLQSLLTFVDTVDAVKVAEGCEAALTKYAAEICPDSEVISEETGEKTTIKYGSCFTKPQSMLRAAMDLRRKTFCAEDLVTNDNSNTLQDQNAFNVNIMEQIIKTIYDEMHIAFTAGCEDDPEVNGIWVTSDELAHPNPSVLAQKYYQKYYGKTITRAEQITEFNLSETGWCVTGGNKAQCENMGAYMDHYDENNDICVLTDKWYQDMCMVLSGYNEKSWNGSQCTVDLSDSFKEDDDTTTEGSEKKKKIKKSMINIADKLSKKPLKETIKELPNALDKAQTTKFKKNELM